MGAVEVSKKKQGADEFRGAFGVENSNSDSKNIGIPDGTVSQSDASELDRPKRNANAGGPMLSSKLTRRLATHVQAAIPRSSRPEERHAAAAKAGGLVLSSELASGSAFANGLIADI